MSKQDTRRRFFQHGAAVAAFGMGHSAHAAAAEANAKPAGYLIPKRSSEISDSSWGLHSHGAFLFPEQYPIDRIHDMTAGCGVKWARVVEHWYRYDKGGAYDWSMLDGEIGKLDKLGIKSFVTFYQQVPEYLKTGGNGEKMFVRNATAYKAFLKYVEAFAKHYRGRVQHYQFFNEPTERWNGWPPEDYGRVICDAGGLIRSVDANAKIMPYTPTGGENSSEWACASVRTLLTTPGVKEHADILNYHHYKPQPEGLPELTAVVAEARKIKPGIPFWTTESGYPSSGDTIHGRFASPWGLNVQAKYLLRNFLTDQHNDVEKSFFFTNVEFYSSDRTRGHGFSTHAFIQHTTWEPKPAYYAFRNLASLIDSTWTRTREKADMVITHNGSFWGIGPHEERFPCVPFQVSYTKGSSRLLVFWLPWIPQEIIKPASVRVSAKGLSSPVWVDLLSGAVHEAKATGGEVEVPLADYPIALADLKSLAVARQPQQPSYEEIVSKLNWKYVPDKRWMFR